MVRQKISFAIEGSLVDLVGQTIPNFTRGSSINLERESEQGIQLYSIPSYQPSFFQDDVAFLLEPAGTNLVTRNVDLGDSNWIKGSNVSVRTDVAPSPLNTFLADRLTFTGGNGVTQLLSKTLSLKAETKYSLSVALRLWGGQFGSKDVIKISGEVAGSNPEIRLDQLNSFPKRYKMLHIVFKSGGKKPTAIPYEGKTGTIPFDVTAITGNTFTASLTYAGSIPANSLIGGQVLFSNILSKKYLISANTPYSGGSIQITVNAASLTTEGVTTSSRAMVIDPPLQSVNLDIYSESTASIDWGGVQIEERPFRSSMMYNYYDEIFSRASTELFYRQNPIASLKTCAIYLDLKYWRGEGNICDLGNLKLYLDSNEKLIAKVGSSTTSPETIPSENTRILLQVAAESSSVSLYINGILKQKITGVSDFVGDLNSFLIFTSDGVRAINRFIVFDSLLLDGQVSTGQAATQDIALVFNDPNIITAGDISANSPAFRLSPVTVPGKKPPIARSQITGLNTSTKVVTVASGTGFATNSLITVTRGQNNQNVLQAFVSNVASNNLTLDNVSGIQVGDYLVYGNLTEPGRSSARFPYVPSDPQTITSIDIANKFLTVANSVTAFTRSRAFIQTSKYQDVAEVLVANIDSVNKRLLVDSVENISVGDTISQPASELVIPPENYYLDFLDRVDGVTVERKYNNGVTLRNIGDNAVDVVPIVRVVL